MAIMQLCPNCRKRQSIKNRFCKCGEDLIRAKKSKRIKYWIKYRQTNGRQKWEYVGALDGWDGCSIDDARAADAKLKSLKKEKKLLDFEKDYSITYGELAEWYLDLESVKSLKSYKNIGGYINKFIKDFGKKVIGDTKTIDLENLQQRRLKAGLKPKTVDDEINYVKTVFITGY